MQHAVINSAWIAAAPAHRLDARFWISVSETMGELGIDPKIAGASDIKRCIAHMDATKARLYEDAADKRQLANRLLDEARDLEKRGEHIRPK